LPVTLRSCGRNFAIAVKVPNGFSDKHLSIKSLNPASESPLPIRAAAAIKALLSIGDISATAFFPFASEFAMT